MEMVVAAKKFKQLTKTWENLTHVKEQNSTYHVWAWAASLWIDPIHHHSIPDITDW
jgi:hypothetical protein